MSPTGRLPLAVLALLLAAACNETRPAQQALDPVPTASPTPVVTTAPPVTVHPTLSPTPSPKPARPTYDVKAVQQQLAGVFYTGPIDGKPGGGFVSAVAGFQKVNGLYGDGIVGKKT